jgi:DNA-binding NarL/FixJ family response regulator
VGSVRVLIVDDQEPFRRAAKAVVASTNGFEVAGEARDGEGSVDAVLGCHPHLVLMDVNLPGIDGLEATRRLSRLTGAPVVVLLSTYELSEVGEDALECGASAYLTKSEFDSGRLVRLWAEVRAAR